LKRLQARRAPEGESLSECAECGEPIPEARRAAIPGVKLCIDCQSERDARPVFRGGINRRGSKDSQLK
jgi:phage/conjugal plasmid C-4 type zinc finger TraR family protein